MKKYVGGKLVTVSAKEQAEIEAEWAENDKQKQAEEAEETERNEIAAALGASDTSEIAVLRAEVKALRKLVMMQSPTLAEAAPLAAVEAIEQKRKGRKP